MTDEIHSFSFPKKEKLTHKKIIGRLFEEGKFVKSYPFKIIYLPNESETHQVAFAVPKRNIKLAVARNKIKRRLREAYRLNKHLLDNSGNSTKLAMVVLYHGKNIPNYHEIASKLVKLLNEIVTKTNQNNKNGG